MSQEISDTELMQRIRSAFGPTVISRCSRFPPWAYSLLAGVWTCAGKLPTPDRVARAVRMLVDIYGITPPHETEMETKHA